LERNKEFRTQNSSGKKFTVADLSKEIDVGVEE